MLVVRVFVPNAILVVIRIAVVPVMRGSCDIGVRETKGTDNDRCRKERCPQHPRSKDLSLPPDALRKSLDLSQTCPTLSPALPLT